MTFTNEMAECSWLETDWHQPVRNLRLNHKIEKG